MKKMFSAAICLMMLCASVMALADDVQWTYDVPLRDCVSDYAMLVNEDHPLDSSYKPTSLSKVTNSSGIKRATKADVYLEDNMLKHLTRMFSDALNVTEYTYINENGDSKTATYKEGMVLYLKSGYRSYGTQKTTYANHLEKNNDVDDGYVAKPGTSEHQTGLCADILNGDYASRPKMTQDFKYTPEAQWMKENCADYGFILRYTEDGESVTGTPFEPWHFRYVGRSVASYIMANDMTLEAFYEESQEKVNDFINAGGDQAAQMAQELLDSSPVLDSTLLELFDETGDAEVSMDY